jgi:nucleoside-diphosphate-sugar epimerase
MSKRVLITGASGFLGYHLIQAALEHNFEVFAAVRQSSKIDHLKTSQVTFTYPDLSSPTQLEENFRTNKYDYIIHAAGSTKARRKEEYEMINAQYAKNVAMAAQESGLELRKFILVSSLAALGPQSGKKIEIKPNPVTSYGISKLKAEQYLAEFNLPLIVIRPTAVYGPREQDIFIILKAISRGLELYIGNSSQQLSFIHVTDLANVTIKLLESSLVQKTYNLTDGDSYDRYALGNIAKQVLGKRTLKIHLPFGMIKIVAGLLETLYSWNGKTPALNREKLMELTAANWYYDIAELKNDIGFKPTYKLENGLKQTLQWYQKHNWI